MNKPKLISPSAVVWKALIKIAKREGWPTPNQYACKVLSDHVKVYDK